jgi:hypothetical protein
MQTDPRHMIQRSWSLEKVDPRKCIEHRIIPQNVAALDTPEIEPMEWNVTQPLSRR